MTSVLLFINARTWQVPDCCALSIVVFCVCILTAFVGSFFSAHWVAEFFRRNRGLVVEATALDRPSSSSSSSSTSSSSSLPASASVQKVVLHDLGLLVDFVGSPPLEVDGSRVPVVLQAEGHVSRAPQQQ